MRCMMVIGEQRLSDSENGRMTNDEEWMICAGIIEINMTNLTKLNLKERKSGGVGNRLYKHWLGIYSVGDCAYCVTTTNATVSCCYLCVWVVSVKNFKFRVSNPE